MAYDEVTGEFVVLNSAEVADFPKFRHRGVLVDTSRSQIFRG
jgi:N-acetyl-beta-hexosaminidase